jgi:hypothetical protein
MRKRKSMILTAGIGLSLVLAGAMAIAQASGGHDDDCADEKHASAPAAHESPFACDRLALDPAARKRHFDELGPALQAIRKAVRELPDGYEFQFPSDSKTIAMVAEWVAAERLCCPFFDIQMRMEPENGPFWLRLTGRKGTKDFIRADGASWIRPVS